MVGPGWSAEAVEAAAEAVEAAAARILCAHRHSSWGSGSCCSLPESRKVGLVSSMPRGQWKQNSPYEKGRVPLEEVSKRDFVRLDDCQAPFSRLDLVPLVAVGGDAVLDGRRSLAGGEQWLCADGRWC